MSNIYIMLYILYHRVSGIDFRTLNQSGYLSDGLCQWRSQGETRGPIPPSNVVKI